MYKQGRFKEHEFTDRFSHVPNVTTAEFVIPLALLPMSDEEAKLRAHPIAPPMRTTSTGAGLRGSLGPSAHEDPEKGALLRSSA